jgi:hypothetical protein
MKLFGDIPLWISTAVIFFRESGERRGDVNGER